MKYPELNCGFEFLSAAFFKLFRKFVNDIFTLFTFEFILSVMFTLSLVVDLTAVDVLGEIVFVLFVKKFTNDNEFLSFVFVLIFVLIFVLVFVLTFVLILIFVFVLVLIFMLVFLLGFVLIRSVSFVTKSLVAFV